MNKKSKILFLSHYPFGKAPSQRLKYEQYYDAFKNAGFDITTSSFISLSFWKIIYQEGHYFGKIFYTVLGYFRRCFDLLGSDRRALIGYGAIGS